MQEWVSDVHELSTEHLISSAFRESLTDCMLKDAGSILENVGEMGGLRC